MSDNHVIAALQRTVADLELRLREVARERDEAYADRARARADRDEARAEASRLDDEAIYQRGLYESARAEVERLRAELRGHGFSECDAQACNCGGWHSRQSVADRLRTVAERQREACSDEVYSCKSAQWLAEVAKVVRATPLVTEGDK